MRTINPVKNNKNIELRFALVNGRHNGKHHLLIHVEGGKKLRELYFFRDWRYFHYLRPFCKYLKYTLFP